MKREDILIYLNKIVFIELKGKLFYTCKILSVGEDSFNFIDKFKITALRKIDLIEDITEITDSKILDFFKSFEEVEGDLLD